MSFVWYFDPNFKAPYLCESIETSCDLANDYFDILVDNFVAKLPEHRQPLEFNDWQAEEHTLTEKIKLIFPDGFGEYDERRNHNPMVWPVLEELSDAVKNGTTASFANEICEAWKQSFDPECQCATQMQLLQKIFDYLTAYLQLFVTCTDVDCNDFDFKHPPVDEAGNLIGSVFKRKE